MSSGVRHRARGRPAPRREGSERASASEGTPDLLPLTALSGVGPARAERLARMGLKTVQDLLLLAPRELERQGGVVSAEKVASVVGQQVSISGRLRGPRLFRRGRRASVLSADLEDETGRVRALYFNQPWLLERLKELTRTETRVQLYGRVVTTKRGPALASPRLATEEDPLPAPGSLLPVYPLTQGIGQAFLRGLCLAAVDEHAERVRDPLPDGLRRELVLPALSRAVVDLHRPRSEAAFGSARRRLALERLLVLQAGLERARAASEADSRERRARKIALSESERRTLMDRLPHRPTSAQARVMEEIVQDLARTRPMRRLLQGEVGSGKTLVGLHAMAAVAAGGGQAALLAPTEILAEQHFFGLGPWLEGVGIRAALLSGSMPAPALRAAREELASGRARLAVGTHALLSSGVRFQQLDLVIVDEQQRFGVAQKRALLEKGADVHLLLMTATPIPRTLALCLWGEIDTSVLDGRLPGRGEVRTSVVPEVKRERALGFLHERMAAGERVFWICPRISGTTDVDGSEDDGAIPGAEEAFATLSSGPLRRFGVELVHGRVPSEQRARRIERFRRGSTQLLIGTSILEVGVDVPEATVMVIDGVDRFGLAQLHQLRGRVGRGTRASWCLLFGAHSGSERMRILESSRDGFAIAEEDLRRRGMGDLGGERQAGANVEGLLDPAVDVDLVLTARRIVRENAALARHYASLESDSPALV